MNKLSRILQRHLPLLMILLFLLLIPLYVINFQQILDRESLKTILDFFIVSAAIISVVFLYLAFRESRLTNTIKLSELEIKLIDKEVTELENMANKQLLSDQEILFLHKVTAFRQGELKKISYLKFVDKLNLICRSIEISEDYQYCCNLLINEPFHHFQNILNEDLKARINNLSIAFSKLFEIYKKLDGNYGKIFDTYIHINLSNLQNEHKRHFIFRLSKLDVEDLTKLTQIKGIEYKVGENILVTNHQVYINLSIPPYYKIIDSIKNKYLELDISS